MLQACDGRLRRRLLRLEFRRIENGDQVSRLHWRTFIHKQFLDTAFHLCADNDLVGVDGSDQHQIAGMICGKKVVRCGNDEDDAEKHEKTIARAHRRAPCWTFSWERNNAAEIKSSTAALRSAIRSGVRGLKPTIFCITGALLK